MVRLYHGSSSDFNKFEIAEKNLKTKMDSLMEGMGIYFTESKEFAEGYGGIIYEVEMDENDCWDCTNKKVLLFFLDEVSKKVNFPVNNYVPYTCIDGIITGDCSVTKFGREMTMWLDSTESFYSEYTEDADELFEKIIEEYEKLLSQKRFIKYWDKSFNCNVYLCRNNEDTVSFKKITL